MKDKMLTGLKENLDIVIYCYSQEIEDYDQTIKEFRRYYREFNDMIFQMYVYDLLSTEEWRYLNDRAYQIREERLLRLIAINTERELKNL